jgi:hypothetical protein
VKVAANLERFPDMKIPYTIKKRMLDFVIRIKNGYLLQLSLFICTCICRCL